MAEILKNVRWSIFDPELKRFFSRLDHYYSLISHRKKLKCNLANRKKLYIFTSSKNNFLTWIENPSDASCFLAYVE